VHGILKGVDPLSGEVLPQQIAVLGLGYVGCVTAACLAHVGHRVVGVDRDRFKVDAVLAGSAPFFEPGLEELVRDNVKAGRLTASVSLPEALADADVALICVGTPSEKNGNLGLDQLRRVSQEIAESLPGRSKPLVVAVRSTVYPGTCEDVVMPQMGGSPWVSVVSNPEFLREGAAVRDFMEPSLLVIGGSSAAAVQQVAAIYAGLPVEPSIVALRTAELIKYACNAFHAVKISFANEIGALAGELGIDGAEVMQTLCRDRALNISPAYLKPGFAFGGSCLPKDLRSLLHLARMNGADLPLLAGTLATNELVINEVVDRVVARDDHTVALLGLSFKMNTDDLRESPNVELAERLVGKGFSLRIYDPVVNPDRLIGANRRYVESKLPHLGRLLCTEPGPALADADVAVISSSDPGIVAALKASPPPHVIDISGRLDRDVELLAGYEGLGW